MYSSYSFTTSVLDEGEWSASRLGHALPPWKGHPVPIVQQAGWDPEPVWTQRLEEKSLTSAGIEPRPPDRPVRSQTLHWLSYPDFNLSLLGLIDSVDVDIHTSRCSITITQLRSWILYSEQILTDTDIAKYDINKTYLLVSSLQFSSRRVTSLPYYKNRTEAQSVVVELLALLLRIPGVSGSDISHFKWLFQVFLSPSRNILGQYLKLGHNVSFHILSSSTFTCHLLTGIILQELLKKCR
jgi:hypothetical protein